MREDVRYWVWLSSLKGVGSRKVLEMVKQVGSAKDIFDDPASVRELLHGNQYETLQAHRSEAEIDGIFEKLESIGAHAITSTHPEYPALLTQAPTAEQPAVLYIRGSLYGLERTIGIIGARRCTHYGREQAARIARDLAEHNACVVSGLARGIDTCAHSGCLEGGGRTVAVLGCGVDIPYPQENAALMERIIDMGGTVISEFPPGVPPLGAHFPTRNRIIAGISQGVLLIEGEEKTGAMITMRYAEAFERERYALPGNVNSRLSVSPNYLIITNNAHMARSAHDIAVNEGWVEPDLRRDVSPPLVQRNLSPAEWKVVNALLYESLSKQELLTCVGMSVQELASLLTSMEIRRIIKQLPGERVLLT